MIKLTILVTALFVAVGGVGVAEAGTPEAQVIASAQERIAAGGGLQVGSGDSAP